MRLLVCTFERNGGGGGRQHEKYSCPPCPPQISFVAMFSLSKHTVHDQVTRQHLAYSNKTIRLVKGRISDKISSSRNNQQRSAVNLCMLFLKWEIVAYFRENCCCSIHPGLYSSHSHISAFILISQLKSELLCTSLSNCKSEQETRRENKKL